MDFKKMVREALQSKLNEGLIQSYDTEAVLRVCQRMGFSSDDIYEKGGSIGVDVKISNKDKYPLLIKNMETMGWFLSSMYADFYDEVEKDVDEIKKSLVYNIEQWAEEGYDPNDTISTLVFEPHYSTRIDVSELPDTLYHVTDDKYLEKIKRQGLKPISKNKLTYHPERIYLLMNAKKVENLINHMDFSIDNPVMLTIDISNLKSKTNFYVDPNLKGGCYIIDNIPPTSITRISKMY